MQVFFNVKDTGIGVDEAMVEKIFESFAQADSSTTRRFGGTGLGLPISKRLAELMGGDITISPRANGGTTVLFNLPFTLSHEPYQNAVEQADVSKKTGGKAKKVLVVEDSQSNRNLIEFYFKDSGHELVMAEDGLEGVNAYRESPDFDTIFMDMQMPEMDGLEATKNIRDFERQNNLSPVHIVALTANACEDDKKTCLKAGCSRFLTKPVKKNQLLNHVISRHPNDDAD